MTDVDEKKLCADEELLLPLLRAWHRALGSEFVTATAVVKEAARHAKNSQESMLRAALKAIADKRPFTKLKFARWLAKHAEAKVGNYRLARSYNTNRRVWRWAVLKSSEKTPKQAPRPKREKVARAPVEPLTEAVPRDSRYDVDKTERAIAKVVRAEEWRRAQLPAPPQNPEPFETAPPEVAQPSTETYAEFKARTRLKRFGRSAPVPAPIATNWSDVRVAAKTFQAFERLALPDKPKSWDPRDD